MPFGCPQNRILFPATASQAPRWRAWPCSLVQDSRWWREHSSCSLCWRGLLSPGRTRRSCRSPSRGRWRFRRWLWGPAAGTLHRLDRAGVSPGQRRLPRSRPRPPRRSAPMRHSIRGHRPPGHSLPVRHSIRGHRQPGRSAPVRHSIPGHRQPGRPPPLRHSIPNHRQPGRPPPLRHPLIPGDRSPGRSPVRRHPNPGDHPPGRR
jgi:hypothetical protein